jgi:aminoglycoside phosphotransferase (APT) family kinase protein
MAGASDRMHDDEIAVDAALVRRLVAAQHPQWAGLPVTPVPSPGTVNAIFRLGPDLCVRLPRVPEWAADLDTELAWLPHLAPGLPLEVPTPVATGSPAPEYPLRWAVYRWLEGVPYADDLVGSPVDAATDLAAFVAALRAVDATGAPAAGRSRTPLAARDAQIRGLIAELRASLDAPAATAVWDAALAAPWDPSGPPVWVHGDLLPPNLLVRDGRLTAVLDFGNVGTGDPGVDVVPAWSVLRSAAARAAFRSALGVDDPEWDRAQGWTLAIALPIIPYYATTNPPFVAMAREWVAQLLDPPALGR